VRNLHPGCKNSSDGQAFSGGRQGGLKSVGYPGRIGKNFASDSKKFSPQNAQKSQKGNDPTFVLGLQLTVSSVMPARRESLMPLRDALKQ
jgi:hypothetical protein